MLVVWFIVLGLLAGGLAGLIGIGGGVIIVPALIYLFHFSQKTAQGTTLALLVLPIGFFAAWTYYKAGEVNIKAALFIIVGFVVGSYFGSHYANSVDSKQLTRIFGAFLLLVATKMLVSG